MKCPKCEKEIKSVIPRHLPALSEQHGSSVKCVAYCCTCGFILGIESDPLERHAQMEQMKKDVEILRKWVEQETRRAAARAAMAQQPGR